MPHSKMTAESEGPNAIATAPIAPEKSLSLEAVLRRLFLSSAACKVWTAGHRWGKFIEAICVVLIMLLCLSTRLFPSIRGEATIYDFDPYFNHRTTKYLAREGFSEFWNWYDDGLMTTSYFIHKVLCFLGFQVSVSDVSVYLPPAFACLTAIVVHCFTKHASGSRTAGLFASLFIGVSPAYVKTSLVGSYDNECIAIFAMLSGFYMWTRAVQRGSMLSALLAAIPSAYMVTAWGGYVFLINAVAVHMVALCVLGLMTPRHQLAYVVFYVILTAFCVNIPFLNLTPLWSSEHMASHAVFVLVSVFAIVRFTSALLPKASVKHLQMWVLGLTGALIFVVIAILALTGKTAWSPRSLTLLDPTYASKHIPIVASVSEHQPTTWTTYFLDLHVIIFLAPLGLIISLRRGEGLFFIGLYGVLACYFSAVMIRLMLVLSPAASMLAGVGASLFVTGVLSRLPRAHSEDKCAREESANMRTANSNGFKLPLTVGLPVLLAFFWLCVMYVGQFVFTGGPIGRTNTPKPDDFREAYNWLRQNTHPKARVMAWWDYGYQVSEVGNRTVFVDNNTWNSTHIATVGLAFASEESEAYAIAQDLDVDYIFVVFGGMARFASDDLNKLIWMVRIASGVYPNLQQSAFLGPRGQFTVGRDAPRALTRSLIYKLSYQHFGSATKGFDFARKTPVDATGIQLRHFQEVYTSENWIVRIYKVRKTDNRDTKMINAIESGFQ
ncbi:oligosaccharyl transferase STT3, putative [Eimeria mitis]|uniref:dolichyl-diphosphooligosaccharide--protein glycotransferase n=1 Tax=Eimeria mitis TaxID=44415 RepID=U6KDE5_9EIME|nr:oligosaccharyl transferase STT3, putative [Eimeria mitis]CDJ33488.1 oligosaccharyl transferase STT3, putative [Eimeria mitis]